MSRRLAVAFLLLSAVWEASRASYGSDYRVVDLTHTQDENAYGGPAFKRLSRSTVTKGYMGPPGQWIEVYEFSQNEHIGTHMDAPSHFTKGGKTIDQIPLGKMAGPGVVVDVPADRGDRNYAVTVADLERWEADHGRIPLEAVVVLRTGKAELYGESWRYYGWASPDMGENLDEAKFHNPGFSGEAAAWLMDERGVNGLAVDCLSPDVGSAFSTQDYVVHRAVLNRGGFLIENVGRAVKSLPARGSFVMAMPYKIGGGSGAPVRLVALLPRREGEQAVFPASSAATQTSSAMVTTFILTISAYYTLGH